MKVDWYRNLGVSTQEERKALVLSARPAIEILKTIVESRLRDASANMAARASYDSPAWPYLQADYLGAARELEFLKDLLTLEEA